MDTEECKVCSGETALFDGRDTYSQKGDFFPGIEVWINLRKGKMDITAVADTYEPNCVEASIPIRFCPVCGRRLGEQ